MPTPAIHDISLGELVQALQHVQAGDEWRAGLRHDVASTNPSSTGMLHGPGGVLSYPGVEPEVFNAMMGVRRGILGQLPMARSTHMTPLFEVITGVGATSGSEPAYTCDPAPIGGTLSGAMITAPYGKYKRKTRTLDVTRLGQTNDRAEPMDLMLVGSATSTGIAGLDGSTPPDAIRSEVTMALWERNLAMDRLLKTQVWTGNPANNNVGGGYREMAGFPLLMNSTIKDAITGVAVPALAPDVRSFQLLKVESNGTAIVNMLSSVLRNIRTKASGTGLDPVRLVLVMKEELYYALTNVWPCAYFTTLCSFDAGGAKVQNIDLGDQIALRDRMRNGNFLLIDGIEYQVVFDDGLPEYSNTTLSGVSNGCFASDIYIVPLTVNGGRAVTYLNVFPFDNDQAARALSYFPTADIKVWGSGAWIETQQVTRTCIDWELQIEPRVVMRTPYLAGRITNVQYCPALHAATGMPGDPYTPTGGSTTRSTPPSYTYPWS